MMIINIVHFSKETKIWDFKYNSEILQFFNVKSKFNRIESFNPFFFSSLIFFQQRKRKFYYNLILPF